MSGTVVLALVLLQHYRVKEFKVFWDRNECNSDSHRSATFTRLSKHRLNFYDTNYGYYNTT